MDVRVARPTDIEALTECVALAFADDPIWSVALRGMAGRPDDLATYWRVAIAYAVRLGAVSMADDGAAVSVWIPPGEAEFDAASLEVLHDLVARSLVADDLAALSDLYDRFDASRARTPGPHHYLSLLATHPDHRGRGVGQRLLADDLRRWDASGLPSYLESTNPANDHRYERAGFRPIGSFAAVLDDAPVTAMWRPVGGAEEG